MGVVFKFFIPYKCSDEEMFGFTIRIHIIDNKVLRHNIFMRYLGQTGLLFIFISAVLFHKQRLMEKKVCN